ncbi:unnamed protein product [Didymodactylos carnosus]|uniref:Polyhomeotic-like protein 2 n=1 Tax=Didymodactylos carnosus TaxID=1234261 RepID=A0A8S2E3L2_9BILA|nr:unnamed protein product [Didymodactylos carnosus]CAF3836209.1 unnamed protein product [Didymodactylos carnosus]
MQVEHPISPSMLNQQSMANGNLAQPPSQNHNLTASTVMDGQFTQPPALSSSLTNTTSTAPTANGHAIHNMIGEQQTNATYAQLIAVPLPAQPISIQSTPTTLSTPPKQTKRGPRASQGTKQINRSPTKQATILAKPLSKSSTILPQPQKAFLLPNQLVTSLYPKIQTNGQLNKPPAQFISSPSTTAQPMTTYLVANGNSYQLVSVPGVGQAPITFVDQNGQVLKSTTTSENSIILTSNGQQLQFQNNETAAVPITTLAAPQLNSFQAAVTSLATQQSMNNSSQTVTTVRTSASIDMQRTQTVQQQTNLISNTDTMNASSSSSSTTTTTQQVTGITNFPATTSILNPISAFAATCNSNNFVTQPILPSNQLVPTSIVNNNSPLIIQRCSVTNQLKGDYIEQRRLSPCINDEKRRLTLTDTDANLSLDEGNHTFVNDSSSTLPPADAQTSLSLAKIARKAQRHRRSSSSSISKKKRGRPRLYERDPLTNKPIRSRPVTELPSETLTSSTATLLTTDGTSTGPFLFPNNSIPPLTQLSCSNPSALQQMTFPTLINNNNMSSNYLSTNALQSAAVAAAPTMNIFSANNTNPNPTPFLYNLNHPTTTQCRSFMAPAISTTTTIVNTHDNPLTTTTTTIPLKNLQISSPSLLSEHRPLSLNTACSPSRISTNTTIPNIIQLTSNDSSSLQKISPAAATNDSSSGASTTSSCSSTDVNNTIQKQNEKPSAVVRPNNNIISHYIDGFIIRESDSPFVSDGKHDDDNLNISKEKENDSDIGSDQLRCDYCKKIDFFERFYGNEKKYCSRTCSTKAAKSVKQKKLATNEENISEPKEDKTTSLKQISKANEIDDNIKQRVGSMSMNNDHRNGDHFNDSLNIQHDLPQDPKKWTIQNVGDFIFRLTKDSQMIKQKFHDNEINGRALLLMTSEHLNEDLKIKLGPSLVISNEIEKLRHSQDNMDNTSSFNPVHSLPTHTKDWTIKHVGEFILRCTDKQMIKDMFYKHEIDGEALLLMQCVHLRQLGINLGPTLVIFNEIEKLRANR